MKLAVGCDPNAAACKKNIIKTCLMLGHDVIDMGSKDPIYANTAFRVAEYVVAGCADRGILICGTGIGMSIAANKVQGAYAALISDIYSAVRACKSNNANIACFGAFTIGEKLVSELVKVWLDARYVSGTSSEAKFQCIKDYEAAK
ncbi:MAG: RpiB/LacA/LacB family sugar-phosphate isomerase [Eubacteriales bacterium]|nr:RpiB/LacA/LacB family sugar-phosphate isomerase [Eubacteriales bacterium]